MDSSAKCFVWLRCTYLLFWKGVKQDIQKGGYKVCNNYLGSVGKIEMGS